MSEYEPDWSEGEDMESAKTTGDGIKVEINSYALERIEAAAVVGVRQELSKRIDKIIADTIGEVIEERLSNAINSMAEAAILEYLTKPRQKTNAWGEATGGGTVSLSELIPQKVESWLSEPVKADGTRANEHYDRKGALSRMEWMMSKHVRDELNIATKAAAAEVTEKAKQVVQAHVGRFVAEQMIPQIELNGSAAR